MKMRMTFGWALALVALAAGLAWSASERDNDARHTAAVLVTTAGAEYNGARGYAEDSAHVSADTGTMALGVQLTTRAALASNADYAPYQLTGTGDVRVRDDDLLTLLGTAGGGAYVRQDSTATIAKESGGNLAAAATSLAAMDDWDENNRCAVNLISGQVGISGGAGAVAATVPRVTLASDDRVVAALEKLDDASGSGLTYTRVKIDQAAAGRATLLEGAANKTQRLHALVGTMGASGTVTIAYDNDGAGASQVTLTGNMPVAAYGGMVIPFCRDPAACLSTDGSATKRYLTIVTTGGAFDGYAVVSTD